MYLGEKLLKVPHKDLSLLLDELLAAELQVSVHILLGVNVVLLYLRRSLEGGHGDKRLSTIKWSLPEGRERSKSTNCVPCVWEKQQDKKNKNIRQKQ